MTDVAAVNLLKDLLRRLRASLPWIAAQFWATVLLLLAGVAWTRLPDKYAWQVGLTLLLPLVLLALLLLMQAGTARKLLDREQGRVPLAMGAVTLLVWVAVAWLAWWVLDWCDDQTYTWASYLNSRFAANERATVFTYEHIQTWLAVLIWIFRWIVVPAKVIPHALASAQWGWRLPWRKLVRLLLDWRWWLAAVVAALLGVELPGHFSFGEPHGTVSHQVWAIALKLAGVYLLAAVCWVLMLAWVAVLLSRQSEPAEDALDAVLLRRLRASRLWIGAQFVWLLLWVLATLVASHLPSHQMWQVWLSVALETPVHLLLLLAMVVLQVFTFRSMLSGEPQCARAVWGELSALLWAILILVVFSFAAMCPNPIAQGVLCWFAVPGLVVPFAAAAAQWGFRLPWQRILLVLRNWRWWLGVLAATVLGVAVPLLLVAVVTAANQSVPWSIQLIADLLVLCGWILLLAWIAVLLERTRAVAQPGDDALVPAPVGSGPLGEDSVKLPLPEGGDDSGGKA
ncbi:MAG: hypothetical protein ABSF23_10420 [Terracidiphilus sp.]|jgi:hypothetical protein